MAKSKYHAKPTVVNGIRFHSMKEARRYRELTLLTLAGEIESVYIQPSYDLNVGEAGIRVGRYVADFSYTDRRTGRVVVEDVKGFKTPLYRWKKRHVEAQYGIEIREI